MFWLWVLAVIFTIIFALYKYIEGNEGHWTKQGIYSVRNKDRGSFWDRLLFREPIHLLDVKAYQIIKKNRKDDKIAGITLFRHPTLYIMDLDLIRNVLVKDFDHFVNRRVFEFNDPTAKLMLINQVNQEWKDLRATMTPTFTTGKIKRMFGVFQESGEKMVKFLRGQIQKSSNIEMQDVCGRYTLDVIASAAFGVDSQNFENENAPFAVHARLLRFNLSFKVLVAFVLTMIAPKVASFFQFSPVDKKAIDFLGGVIKESIRRRKELGEKRNDFLQLMIEAQNDQLAQDKDEVLDDFEKNARVQGSKKYELTDEILIAQCNLFFAAGSDTVETLLMWATYELAIHPEIQEKLYLELREAVDSNGGNLSYDAVVQLKYLEMIISETLRKYPAALRLERKCNADFSVPNSTLVIKKGTHVAVPLYALHHDSDLYPNPHQFDPERYNAENKATRHPYAYMPFGMGPRNCIAMRFAQMEGKTAVAHLILNFRLSPCTKTDIPMKFSTSGVLKPVNGLWINLETRE